MSMDFSLYPVVARDLFMTVAEWKARTNKFLLKATPLAGQLDSLSGAAVGSVETPAAAKAFMLVG